MKEDRNENIGEFILETILSSNIAIKDLNLFQNSSWFKHPDTQEYNVSNEDLLAELIDKQVGLGLHQLYLDGNYLSSNATKKILSRIAAWGN